MFVALPPLLRVRRGVPCAVKFSLFSLLICMPLALFLLLRTEGMARTRYRFPH